MLTPGHSGQKASLGPKGRNSNHRSMRIFRPKRVRKPKLSVAQRESQRTDRISFLHSKGYSLEMLTRQTDKHLWQMANRYGTTVLQPQAKIQRPKSAL